MTPDHLLELPLTAKAQAESGATTIQGYLVALVEALWGDDAGNVDGKRPFGSSSWRHDLYEVLINAVLIDGAFDEDGYIERVDDAAGDRLIREAIAALGRPHLVEAVIMGRLEGPVVVAPAAQDPEHTAMAVVEGVLSGLPPGAAGRVAEWVGARWKGPA